MTIGRTRWAIAGGWVPCGSTGKEPQFTSCDTISVLNAGVRDSELRLYFCFEDAEPAGPFRLAIGARRVRKVRVNDLIDPHALPLETPYGLLVEADDPVVVQFTRQDTRERCNALIGTLACPLPD